ncbi:hypothetical protein CUMW_236500 [Citrus unshiu]|uniref:Uncharacterized protein n=1 Tax=Citrus unshiu TaxID=55188 RepID=A0A2H5QJN0_CITUN|nr:hypothetical protein CUMW_236500 [Citrus unshiu]
MKRKRGEVEGHNKGKDEGNNKGNSKGIGEGEGEVEDWYLVHSSTFMFVGDMAEKEEPTYDPDLEGKPRRNLTKKKDL